MQPKSRSRRKPTELKVVFDSSAIYSGSASNLLNEETVRLIEANRRLTEPKLTWCLPAVVVLERQYQMKSRALDLLPSIEKLERLLGHSMNITEEILDDRIRSTIQAQVTDLGLTILELDYSSVDWHRVVSDAAGRIPPFEAGDKEKGFRDAIIAETFAQLVNSSPSTPQLCRVILVAGDGLLLQAVSTRASSLANVSCLPTLNELSGLINTLASQVSETYVAALEAKAKAYFFSPGDGSCLFLKQDIRGQILIRFKAELENIPPGADRRTNHSWYISSPRFLTKERQRISWASRVSVEAKASKPPTQTIGFFGPMPEASSGSIRISGSSMLPDISMSDVGDIRSTGLMIHAEPTAWTRSALNFFGSSGGLDSAESIRVVTTGSSVFEVTWSISVDASKRFSHPKIETITYLGTNWE